jgi:hypothetical protein
MKSSSDQFTMEEIEHFRIGPVKISTESRFLLKTQQGFLHRPIPLVLLIHFT